jgi:hypothetical protein
MPELANPNLLDREQAASEASELFHKQFEVLSETVNHGTNLIIRILRTCEPSIVREMAVGSLFRRSIQNIDSIDLLLRSSCVTGATIQARALLETSLTQEWMLKENQHERARAYYVTHLRTERAWNLRMLEGTPEKEQMDTLARNAFGETNRQAFEFTPDQIILSRERVKKIDEILTRDGYRHLNEKLERFRKNRGFERPDWIGLTCPSLSYQFLC